MPSKGKRAGKHSFEIRIHLEEKKVRIANFPAHSQILELDDPNKIDPKDYFLFYVSMNYERKITRMTKMKMQINLTIICEQREKKDIIIWLFFLMMIN